MERVEDIKLSAGRIRRWLPSREGGAHKGNFGHVLILAGSRNMAGASVLCAGGALRAGAGLVTVGVPEGRQDFVVSKLRSEVMTFPLPQTRSLSISERGLPDVLRFIRDRGISSLALGPGISTHPSTARFVKKILRKAPTPAVLDADGLNAVSSKTMDKGMVVKDLSCPGGLIVTPHPGELARLTGQGSSIIQKDRIGFCMSFARANNLVCILKGSGTVISDGRRVFVNNTGNPGMATGGSGDVLTGMIAALVPQVRVEDGPDIKERLLRAACVGVYLHGLAGDLAAAVRTEIGMVAGDIVEFIPEALKKMVSLC